MDARLGLSLLLLSFHVTDALSKNIRDGPMFQQRHHRRTTLSEFLTPPLPSASRLPHIINSMNLVPAPLPDKMRGQRNRKNMNPPRVQTQPGYFTRFMDWFNVLDSQETRHQPPRFSSFTQPQQQLPQYVSTATNRLSHSNGVHPSNPATFSGSSPFSRESKSCSPCNEVPWVPITGSPVSQNPQNSINVPQYDVTYSTINKDAQFPGYLPPQEYKQPDYHAEVTLDLPNPLPNLANYEASSNSDYFPPFPPGHSENSPPIYKAQNFVTPVYNGGTNEVISASGPSNVHHEAIPESSNVNNVFKTVMSESSISGFEDFDDSGRAANNWTQKENGKIHFEQSPVIEIGVASNISNSGERDVTGPLKENVKLIDYIVDSEYDSSESSRKSSFSKEVVSDEKLVGLSAAKVENVNDGLEFGNSYGLKVSVNLNDEKKQGFLVRANESVESSIEVMATPVVHDPKSKYKQVQIIIPYTSQHTPSPFYAQQKNKGSESIARNVNRATNEGAEKVFDNAIGQESRAVQVTQLPDSLFYPTRVDKVTDRNNSIDVQRLQKNIDNWTIEEYSSILTPKSVLNNATRPYLSISKKIPREYLTTPSPKVTTEKLIISEYSEEDSYGLDSYEDVIEHTTQVIDKESTTNNPTKNTENFTVIQGQPWSQFKTNQLWKKLTTTVKTEENGKVYVVTARTLSQKEIDETNSIKTSVEDQVRKKPYKSKKSYETIERAYQVLPQAVNNLAVASTGPENVPLWGIMEHEDFALPVSKGVGKKESVETPSPIIYSGQSKVSHVNR